tara:strand:+ start:804 stop:947 length:144 start_codon:yes stop_codon:yes gene_type:complete
MQNLNKYWDKPYPKYIIVPQDYWTTTPNNVTYVTKCPKCSKNKKGNS